MRTLLAIASFTLCLAAHAQVIYVDVDATGANNGTSWTDAYTDLQDALATATLGDEIWVAEGVYKPTTTTDRTVSFVLIDGVALYGGFGGSETSRDERDWTVYESILSGDIGVQGDSTDNSYHVVIANDTSPSTIVDGVVIERGMARGGDPPDDRGAGVLAINGNLSIRNTTFFRNVIGSPAGGFKPGGGLYVENGSPHIDNCTFVGNRANRGGGIYLIHSEATITNSVFMGNRYAQIFFDVSANVLIEDVVVKNAERTGIHIESSSPTFRRVTFRDNVGPSTGDGGAVFITDGAAPVFEDCLFENNTTGLNGGAVFSLGSTPSFINSIFRGNVGGSGGGAFMDFSDALFLNCTFERNRALSSGGVRFFESGGAVVNTTFYGNRSTHTAGGGTLTVTGSPGLGSPLIVANTVLVGNRVLRGGGALYFLSPGPVRVVNVTAAANDAGSVGAALWAEDAVAARVENTIFWGNTSPGGEQIYVEDEAGPIVRQSLIQGGYAEGTDILDEDPLFVRNPDPGPDMTWGTDDDDYGDLRLRMGSPGIDYGLEAFLPADIWDLDGDGNTTEPLPVDLNGDPRVLKTEVDLGPYEGAVIVSNEQEVPEAGFALSVFPNPSREAADLRFRPARPSHINIAVFDLLGRQVAVLADERFNAGSYQRVFDGRELPSGTYVIRAHVVPQDGSAPQTHTQRLTLLK